MQIGIPLESPKRIIWNCKNGFFKKGNGSMKWISFFLLTSFMFLNSAFSLYRPKVFSGQERLTELFRFQSGLQNEALVNAAQSTAAIIPKILLEKIGNVYRLISGNFGNKPGFCSEDAQDGISGSASCSAFLVAPDLMATAGHCISQDDCEFKAFLFGYAVRGEMTLSAEFPEENIYFCRRVLRQEVSADQDYALVQLDRPVRGFSPVSLSLQDPQVNDQLFVVGYPSTFQRKEIGKETGEVAVHSVGAGSFTVDSASSRPGSPVFDAETMEVKGLVAGHERMAVINENQCQIAQQCAEEGCTSQATKISFIVKALNTTYLD
jgi:hypothetical protein